MSEFQSINASSSPEVQCNENNESIEWSFVYAKRHPVTTGLTWGYYGGRWGGILVTAGTLALTNNAENFIVVHKTTGAISVQASTGSPSSSANWSDTSTYARVYVVRTSGGAVTNVQDHRAGQYGIHGGSSSASVTFVAPRVTSTTTSSTPTPNADTTDIYILTALASNATFGAPTGSPVQGQVLIIRIKDSGGSPTPGLSFNAIYRAIGVTLPTAITSGKTMYIGCMYNSTDNKWDVTGVREES